LLLIRGGFSPGGAIMYRRNWEDFVSDTQRVAYKPPQLLNADLTINDGPAGSVKAGALDSNSGEVFVVHLTAGVTYTFAQRPTASGGIVDPLLTLYAPDKTYITYDDDGGAGRSSLLTYTATTTGDFYLVADSWLNAFSTGGDFGAFEIYQWDSNAPDTGATNATAISITDGTTFGQLSTSADIDMYKIHLDAGQFYTFGFSGGFDGAGEPGVIARVQLYDAAGTLLGNNLATESSLSYFNQAAGDYYVKITPFTGAGTGAGGYTLDVDKVDPSARDPLQSLNWDSADNIDTVMVDGKQVAYVYFAPAGVNFGELADDGVTPMTTYGWTEAQKTAVMTALGEYTPITGIEYRVTTDVNQAEFRMITTTSTLYGARFYPQDDASYGTQQGIGTFNLNSGGFGTLPESLLPGGYSYAVILHEFGHAHGIAHPHDNGGGSEIMLGVNGPTNSYGVYDLNQGVYTVMSYNDGWDFHPDGPTTEHPQGRIGAVAGHGWSETLGAFDIAVLQARYGKHDYNTGNNTYALTDNYLEASYKTIWDTGGNDTIAYSGNLDAHIDLTAATLDYTPTGGGAISFLHNVPQNDGDPTDDYVTEIKGGYTIANGVVVENATGGSGNDLLVGNSANNVLTGNAGNDTLGGRGGIDLYKTGTGTDTVIVSLDNAKIEAKKGSLAYDIVTDFDGAEDKLDFSDLDARLGTATNDAFKWIGTSANKAAGDLSYKVFDSINGAEKALGIEIDNYSGAHNGKVTVVMANVDGGAADYAVVLLGSPPLDASDFIL
jgi:hypothetical protein